jgi:recombination protein RecT
MTTQAKTEDKAIAKAQDSPAARFTGAMMREFSGIAGSTIELSPDQRRLAQHLFLKIDETLKTLEAKRLQKGDSTKQPIIWQNVNMQKLAIDAMRRIEIGLDALIDNHISPIPYWNSKEGKYDLDLRIGYAGKDYYKRRFAINPPKHVIYELVYSSDKFKVVKKSAKNPVESYELEVTNPWDRGDIVGGFAYIIYEDETKNQVIVVSDKEFKRSQAMGNQDFWTKNPAEMRYKTVVNRAMAKLWPDPEKTPESYRVVEAEYEAEDEGRVQSAIDEGMSRTVDQQTGEIKEPEKAPETKQEPAKKAPFL